MPLRSELVPRAGFVDLEDKPGFGYEIDPDVIAGRVPAALIW